MSMWISLRTTTMLSDAAPLTSYTILPKIIPFSVDATLTFALILQKSLGANTHGCGFSTNFKSPKVANSNVQFCSVSPV
uniref:Putative secreted protein n=1 Tax=Panstrongylus lignarius TaxID=156445 RepID=A0A224Y3L1_9HEMI